MTTTLVKDPLTGTFASNADSSGTGRTMVDLNGGVVTPASGTSATVDPYTVFNTNVASMLKQIQNAQTQGAQNLGGAKDYLNTESVAPNGPAPANPSVFSGSTVAGQTALQGSFAPAITSINTQLGNTNTALESLKGDLGTMAGIFQPTQVAPGGSTVTPQGTVVHQGHSYTPQINPTTNQVDGFDQNTGTWASEDAAAGNGDSSGGNPGIEAIFGKSNPIGAYASDPNYVSEISGLYKTVSASGAASTPDSLQQYVTNNAKGAPVTGQMILNAAGTYGIDPALLTTVLLHESDFGTAGAATTTMNPGNIGNTGTSTQAFPSWQQGVMAAAKNIANRVTAAGMAPASATTPGTTGTSNVGGNFNTVYSQKVSSLPPATQNYVDAGPFGVGYINDDRVPATVKASVQASAARAGIPYLATADVASLQSLTAAQQNMANMKTAANETLGSGFFGGLGDVAATYINKGTFGNAFTNFAQFNGYASAAIAALKGLAGSGGGFRITQAEIDTAQENMPSSTDTIEHARTKMQVLQGLINTTVAKIFPDAPIPITLKDGSAATVPAKNYSAAVALGAVPQ